MFYCCSELWNCLFFFWKTEIVLLHHYTLWLYSSNITLLFLRITLICTIVLIQNLLTQGGNKFQSYLLGLKRRKCFQCLCEQLDLDFAKYLKMCNIFTWWLLCWYVWRTNQFYVYLYKPSLICLWRGNYDLICCLVYIWNLIVTLARAADSPHHLSTKHRISCPRHNGDPCPGTSIVARTFRRGVTLQFA